MTDLFKSDNRSEDTEDKICLIDYWKLIVKRKKIIIGAPIVLMICALVAILIMPEIYSGVAYLRITVMEAPVTKVIPNGRKVQLLTAKGVIESVGYVDATKISRIFKLNADSIQSLYMTDMVQRWDLIKVKIKSNNANIIPEAIASLAEYIQNLDCIKNLPGQTIASIKFDIKEITLLLKKAEDKTKILKKKMLSMKKETSSTSSIRNEINSLYVWQATLRIEQQRLEQEMKKFNQLTELVEVNDLNISRFPLSPRGVIIVAGFIGLLMGIFLLFFFEYIERINLEL